MKPNQPALAVLIPFYGSTQALRKTLLSLAADSVPHDVILVDDGNPTPLSIPADVHPNVIVLRHAANRGITAALNTGLDFILRVGYPFIARLDAGDTNINSRFQKQLDYLHQNPTCKLVGSFATYHAPDGRALFLSAQPCTSAAIRRGMHRQSCFIHATVLLRTEVFVHTGFYSDFYPAAEDYDLFFRIAMRFPTANIPEALVAYEVNPGSISALRRRTQVLSRLRIVLAHFDPLLAESWRGVIESLVSLALPRAATVRLNQLLTPARRISATR
jgi:glycosyltransferase involved in cell wall biosynthesis